MASESLHSSDERIHSRTQQSLLASQREKAAQVPTAPTGNPPRSGAMFPLGYKEGFSQWWASLPAAVAEHKVLSCLPYLQHNPPTHLQTGRTADSPAGRRDSLSAADHSQQGEVEANSRGDPYGPRRWRSSMVELSGKNRALNEFSVERVGEKADQHLVMIHGYGAGLGFFYKNFEPLSRLAGWQVYALDLLGMGRSTRPPFRIKAKNRVDAIKEAEDWFVDALEEWRLKRNIDRFTLMGHSLGGYMAVVYALKYPGHLNKLILASPVGIPEDPYAVSAEMPEPTQSTLSNEFTQDQRSFTEGSSVSVKDKISDNNNFLNARTKAAATSKASSSSDSQSSRPERRQLPKWFAYLWDANVSPFSFVRWAGPLGPRLVSGWTSRRFSHLPADEAKALHDYSYSIFRLRGSGEYALAYILAPGAFARSPLIRRIHGVGRQYISSCTPTPLLSSTTSPSPFSSSSSSSSSSSTPAERKSTVPATSSPADTASSSLSSPDQKTSPQQRENGIPIVFMYGDHDWMDVSGGHAAKAKIEQEKQRALLDATAEEREADNGSAKVVIINQAGHHLYLDGWEEFNQVVLAEMEDVSKKERARRSSQQPPVGAAAAS